MSVSANDLISNPEQAFKLGFTNSGAPISRQVKGQPITSAYNKGSFNERLSMRASEAEKELGDFDPAPGTDFKYSAAKHLISVRRGEVDTVDKQEWVEAQKVGGNLIDSGISQAATPLVYDPDVLFLLKEVAPHAFGSVTRRGQQGHQVVFNNIQDIEDPAGWGSEQDSTNLQDINRDFGFETPKVDLSIYMDGATVTDFSAEASAHYMDLAELSIGSRLRQYAKLSEITLYYGDPDTEEAAVEKADLDDGETGGPRDPHAFTGIAELYPENDEAVDDDVLEFIKSEIAEIKQSEFASMPTDMEVWMSHTLYDHLENELIPRARHDENAGRLDFGNYQVHIGGVPVVPSHNIDEHTFSDNTDEPEDYTVGDPNDVFIVNTSTLEYRELLPLTTIPLATRGASSEVGMVEFGTLIERSASEASGGGMEPGSAEFGRYLSGLSVV